MKLHSVLLGKLEPQWGRIPRETKPLQWMVVAKLIFIWNIEILNKYKMDTKYNNNIIWQKNKDRHEVKYFWDVMKFFEYTKACHFLKHILNSNQNTMHTSNMSSILVRNYDNAVVYTFLRYSLHIRSNIYYDFITVSNSKEVYNFRIL